MSLVHLEKLKVRYIVNLELESSLESRIHVGSIQEGILKRMIWANVKRELKPIIPADSLKGSWRKLASKFAKNINFEDEEVREIVKYHKEDFHYKIKNKSKNYPQILNNLDKVKKIITENIRLFSEEQIKELSDNAIKELYASLKCPVCKLFGSGRIASKMIFKDAILEKEGRINIYTGTSIDRKTKIVYEKRLFSIESIEGPVIFKSGIIIENVKKGSDEAKVLSALIKNIFKLGGFYVGGSKSRGYGLLKINENSEVLIQEFNLNPKNAEEIKDNIRKLLNKKFDEKLKIKDFAEWLVIS